MVTIIQTHQLRSVHSHLFLRHCLHGWVITLGNLSYTLNYECHGKHDGYHCKHDQESVKLLGIVERRVLEMVLLNLFLAHWLLLCSHWLLLLL